MYHFLNSLSIPKFLLLLAIAIPILIGAWYLLIIIMIVSIFYDHYKDYHNTSSLTNDDGTVAFMYYKYKYMKSDLWKKKRQLVLQRDQFTCQSCSSHSRLEVHHMKDYTLIPNEPLTSLVTLCRSCHEYQHKIHGFPSNYVQYRTFYAPLIKKPTYTIPFLK